jgi:hypothetical protein
MNNNYPSILVVRLFTDQYRLIYSFDTGFDCYLTESLEKSNVDVTDYKEKSLAKVIAFIHKNYQCEIALNSPLKFIKCKRHESNISNN